MMQFPFACTFALTLPLALASIDQCLAAERLQVTSIKPLLITAIDKGDAHGELVGAGTKFMHGRFKSAAPVEIDVKTVGALNDPNCKRLEVTTRQDEVYEPGNHESARKKLVFEVSYCRDGRFPGAQ